MGRIRWEMELNMGGLDHGIGEVGSRERCKGPRKERKINFPERKNKKARKSWHKGEVSTYSQAFNLIKAVDEPKHD
jgi:hypothetical protein